MSQKVFVRLPGENCKRTMAPSLLTKVEPAGSGKFQVSIFHPNSDEATGEDQAPKVLLRKRVSAKSEKEAKMQANALIRENLKAFQALNLRDESRGAKGEQKNLKSADLSAKSLDVLILNCGHEVFEISVLNTEKTEVRGQKEILYREVISASTIESAFSYVNSVKNSYFKHIKTTYEKPLPEQAKRAKEKAKAKAA